MEEFGKWVEVKSSNIEQLKYDPEQRQLQVKFYHGGTYSYHPITEEGYKELLKAESVGEHFAKHIRSNPHITATKGEEKENG